MVRLLSDAENVVREEDILDHAIEGSLDHAIALLESYRGLLELANKPLEDCSTPAVASNAMPGDGLKAALPSEKT